MITPLRVVTESHVRDEATTYIRTHIAGAGADYKEIDILHSSSGCLHAVVNRSSTYLRGAAQIRLIQLIRTFSAIQTAF